jgi:hypothetical protein
MKLQRTQNMVIKMVNEINEDKNTHLNKFKENTKKTMLPNKDNAGYEIRI